MVFGMVTLALAVTSGWLAIAVSAVISITRAAPRTLTIVRVATFITITRRFVSRMISQQAHGLTIVQMSKIMTRAGVPHNVTTFGLAVATEI